MSFAEFLRGLHGRRAMARDRRLPSGILEGIASATAYDIALNYSPFQAPAPQPVADGRGTVTARPIPTIGNVGVYHATSVAPAAAVILRPDAAVTGDISAVSKLFDAVTVRELALAVATVAKGALEDSERAIGTLMTRV